MRKRYKFLVILTILALALTACGGESDDAREDKVTEEETSKLQLVTSFTIIADMAEEIAGEKLEIYNLVPTGTDPHEYEPLPEDIKKTSDADILFYNGMNLEGGEDGWFFRMIDSVDQKEENIYNLTEGLEPLYLSDSATGIEEVNPHSFTDPAVGIAMAENIADALIEKDSENSEFYQEQAQIYIDELEEIDRKYQEVIDSIPEENRILVTSERAFQHMATHYGLKEGYIWAVDTEENGTPEQIKSLLDFIEENDVSILFVESNVDRKPMETISKESGLPIFEKPIYSDELGEKGEEIDTYIKYLNYNLSVIEEGLSLDN